MSSYLEEAAAILRRAAKSAEDAMPSCKHQRRLEAADGFARLAAIERGVLPPEWLADLIHARDKREGGQR